MWSSPILEVMVTDCIRNNLSHLLRAEAVNSAPGKLQSLCLREVAISRGSLLGLESFRFLAALLRLSMSWFRAV